MTMMMMIDDGVTNRKEIYREGRKRVVLSRWGRVLSGISVPLSRRDSGALALFILGNSI